MRGINYAVGFGTILIFAGIYCFKTLFAKHSFVDKEGQTIHKKLSAKNKVILIIGGCAFIIAGGLLIFNKFPI